MALTTGSDIVVIFQPIHSHVVFCVWEMRINELIIEEPYFYNIMYAATNRQRLTCILVSLVPSSLVPRPFVGETAW